MTTPAPVKAWAVQRDNGDIILRTVNESELKCKVEFAPTLDWETWEKMGYKCIPVTVTPEGGKR